MTNREIVSQIRSMNKLLSGDNLINDRVILKEAKDVANMIVQQGLAKRKYWQSPNVFTYIPCLQMEQVPLSECCEYTSPKTIAKSKEKLPKIGEGIFGLAVQGVFGLDISKKFKEMTPNRYANLLKLNLRSDDIYYWVMNDHLYVTNPDTESVELYAYFTEDIPNTLLFPGKDCSCKNKPSISDLCTPYLDKTFYFPLDRIHDLKQQVYKNLLATYFNVPSEENKTSNNREESSK